MPRLNLSGALVAVLPVLMVMSCGRSDTSFHHFVKGSAVTAKVQARLSAKHLEALGRVKVETDEKAVVWLSGRAPTEDASELAATIAKSTQGVTSVHDTIVVDP